LTNLNRDHGANICRWITSLKQSTCHCSPHSGNCWKRFCSPDVYGAGGVELAPPNELRFYSLGGANVHPHLLHPHRFSRFLQGS